jgi:hypothetical protein
MFRSNQKVLLVKVEDTPGSDSNPVVGSNAIEAANIKVSYKGDLLERNIQKNTLSPTAPVMGKRSAEVTFECELKGSGTRGAAGKLSDLLQACGFAETISVGSSVTYTPHSGTMKTATIYVYDMPDTGSARLHKITGAVGNMKLSLEAGAFGKIEFSFQGKYNAVADVVPPGTPTYETTLPPIVESSQFTLNSVTSLIVQALQLDTGNGIIARDDISSANGVKDFMISTRKAQGTFSPEAVTIATYDWWSDWIAATARAMSVVVGSVSGNICTITAPKVTIDQVTEADRNAITTDEIPFRCSQNVGNDELQIKFT